MGRAAIALALALSGCAAREAPPAAPSAPRAPRCVPADRRAAIDAFVARNQGAYATAIRGARGFLDGLQVDPAELRAVHIKGKKKLAEIIDAYYRLFQIAPPGERAAILARVNDLARPTREAAYHDLATIDDRRLHEDATSYLRVAVLLDRLGIDITRYRAEIRAVKGRLDTQMKDRGPHQRRAFHGYYQHFGLAEPFPLAGALAQGLIAGRADPDKLARLDVYAVTHEVYAAYDFGDRLDADPFSEADRAYLKGALPRLMKAWLDKRDPDLVAEIVTTMRYLGFTSDPAYEAGLGYLLGSQNEDGSWGDYPRARARMGDWAKPGFYLHTTMVVIEALTLAFDPSFRRGEPPACG